MDSPGRKMSAHAVQKMTRARFRVMSLAPRQKCERNVVQMKEAMNSRSCRILKIVSPEICFDFLTDWSLVRP